MTRSERRPPPDGGTWRKTTLYCPDCGHESTIDGDWHVEHTTDDDRDRAAYICPECGAVIARRPTRLAIA
ncbi:phage terminase large subunit family protein [Halococcus saccharolyticus]|uniref:DUF8106 domain-containing protein n=1 Tax=Halococcus saccharolyticus DSM 5350 TaxID=1227455 RepID=M0MI91_9EURY|nr:phage terminase large subunit family protein [Halococcus saccharolyticus]EMA44155.1 hypothetical protein C449_11533 [Halococcus saccharolyticus DSM 5350]